MNSTDADNGSKQVWQNENEIRATGVIIQNKYSKY